MSSTRRARRVAAPVALLLEVDPIGLVRGRKGPSGDGFALGQDVNDRPYALELLRRLFEPIGWNVTATTSQLDPKIPEWGDSRYLDVRLAGDVRLADALNHLDVLLPVLDYAKHYWVSNDEVDKLIRAGGGWLATHPEKALISRRYLSHRRELAQSAMPRPAEVDDAEIEQFDSAVEGALVLDTRIVRSRWLSNGAALWLPRSAQSQPFPLAKMPGCRRRTSTSVTNGAPVPCAGSEIESQTQAPLAPPAKTLGAGVWTSGAPQGRRRASPMSANPCFPRTARIRNGASPCIAKSPRLAPITQGLVSG